MTRVVNCARLNKELPGLERAPYPGELGQRIYDTISEQAWLEWQQRQTMMINEYRLSMLDPEARSMLEKEMVAFLFEGKDEMPAGYTE